jgi:hypothetical protein
MRSTDTDNLLADHERSYRELTAQLATELATIGLIHSGSVLCLYTHCGKQGCRLPQRST